MRTPELGADTAGANFSGPAVALNAFGNVCLYAGRRRTFAHYLPNSRHGLGVTAGAFLQEYGQIASD